MASSSFTLGHYLCDNGTCNSVSQSVCARDERSRQHHVGRPNMGRYATAQAPRLATLGCPILILWSVLRAGVEGPINSNIPLVSSYRCIYVQTYIHTCTCTYMYGRVYIYIHTSIRTYTNIIIYMCICIYIHTCIYICIYILPIYVQIDYVWMCSICLYICMDTGTNWPEGPLVGFVFN